MRYEDVADLLPELADGAEPADPAVARFVAADLRAQAELVRYRRMLRLLGQLREQFLVPPNDLLDDVFRVLETGRVPRGRRGRRIVVAAAIGGAVAGATAAAVLVARSRRRLAA